MTVELGFLRTRVARRILLLFVLSALLPAAALSVVAYRQVRAELIRQSRDRIENVAKSAGMSVYERLLFLQRQLALQGSGAAAPPGQDGAIAGLNAVTKQGPGEPRALVGAVINGPPLDARDRAHMAAQGAVLKLVSRGSTPEILLAVPAPDDPERSVLWGRVDPAFLWSSAEGYAGLSTTAAFCVFDSELVPLTCDFPDIAFLRSRLGGARVGAGSSQRLQWLDLEGDEYLVGAWDVFLGSAFRAPSWRVAVAERRDQILSSLEAFRTPFLAVVVFGLAMVALLSNVQVRRTLAPLLELKQATRRIADRDFDTRVRVESADEFEELGDAFNEMARDLGAQFGALEAIDEIDRAILSELDRDAIAASVLQRIPGVVPATRVALVLESDEPGRGILYHPSDGNGSPASASLNTAGLAELCPGSDSVPVDLGSATAPIPGLDAGGLDAAEALVVPVRLRERTAGWLILVHAGAVEYSPADLDRTRQIADQISVALANARLVDELEHLTWGALTALARAIDAKSPWTSGHSERVAALAGRTAKALGLDDGVLETLHRGALLHDIGKIGIPGGVLDKPTGLTQDERVVMKSHPEVGARILEPIEALANLIPIALYHHEWYDGSGYPAGLTGTEIPLLARILAVADVYDALTSDRPYRPGLAPEVALERIADSAGSQFDPEIVEVFIRVQHAATTPRSSPSATSSD